MVFTNWVLLIKLLIQMTLGSMLLQLLMEMLVQALMGMLMELLMGLPVFLGIRLEILVLLELLLLVLMIFMFWELMLGIKLLGTPHWNDACSNAPGHCAAFACNDAFSAAT